MVNTYGAGHLVRLGILVKKTETENGRGGRRSIARGRLGRQWCDAPSMVGSKGPYLLGRMNLKTGTNRPVKSQAVNWATAGLLAPGPPSVLAGVQEQYDSRVVFEYHSVCCCFA